MLHIVVVLGAIAYASAQYGAPQPPVQNDYNHQAPPPPPPNPVVVGCQDSVHSEETSSLYHYGTNFFSYLIFQIRNFIDHHGCKVAVLSCGQTKEPVTLETIEGEKLSEGIDFEKVVRCGRNERWCTRNTQDNSVNFRTVRCIVNRTRPPRPQPRPPFPRPPLPPRPQPIAE
ncbi:hypothetical protein ANCCEY_02533 [Ancylostoma ceylanicum]|uniref:ZP domain-containing protein n=1 Tax=Ancylostoma ceylanicum TaxID=53326 RepID=A0A0D6M2Q1_9BILA|nr:hypothetical protein ANCCEY_02533 [Ancylostoma ceylanicum]